jgi:plastocyanin
MTLRKILITTASAFAALGAVTLAWAGGQATVDQAKLQFSVMDLVVKKGSTVTFRNLDRTSHNIQVAGGMSFDGGLQRPGQDLDVLFAKGGDYTVTCGIHPKMLMRVHAK